MSGKICTDEISVIKDLVQLECIKLPKFMKDLKKYKQRLRLIALVNGITKNRPSEIVNDCGTFKANGEVHRLKDVQNLARKYIDNEIAAKTNKIIKQKPKIITNINKSTICSIL
jgi:hypothetical protein